MTKPQDPGPDWAAQRAKEIMSASYKGQGVGWSPADIQEHLAHALAAERDRALEDAISAVQAAFANRVNSSHGATWETNGLADALAIIRALKGTP